jgi:hypothetical protein
VIVTATLGDLAAWYDELGFVGRVEELDVVQRMLDQSDGGVVLVYGPGGIGKSALLREIARRAVRAERPVVSLDLRDATPSPEVLDPVRAAAAYERPVITIDTFEHVAALSGYLRTDVLPALPIGSLVVIATRLTPENAWASTEWERLTTQLALQPLSTTDSTALLHSRGLVEPAAVNRALRWTGGNPLGLALAAEHPDRVDPTEGVLPPAEVATHLTRRLLDVVGEPAYEHIRALVVASIARVTTPELLRAVLADKAASDEAWRWLTGRSFITGNGAGVAPHELLSRALRTEVRANSPELEHGLRRRVVDVLAADALSGGSTSTADLVHLVDNAAIRWGFGVNATTHHLDMLRPEDVVTIRSGTNRLAAYLPLLEPWLATDPPSCYVVRHAAGAVAGVGLAFSTATAPDRAWRDPFVGPRLAHARANHAGPVLVWHCSVSVDEDPTGAVQGLLGIGGYLATSTPNPVASYIGVTPSRPEAVAFAAAVSAVHVPELDAVLADGSAIQVHVINHGPAGLVQHIHRTVYAELGLPESRAPSPRATDRQLLDLEEVRTALRAFNSDQQLAGTPLADQLVAAEPTRHAKADRLRAVLLEAVESAWPDSLGEERRALDIAYVHPSGGNPATTMHMSRSSWFRLLRRALQGVVDHLDTAPPSVRAVPELSRNR